MTEEQERLIREQNLAYFGAVTASVSHELSNVVTIINELSGLLGDMLDAAERGKEIDNAKLARLQQKLSNQVARADGIIKRMNRFAHSSDTPLSTFDANVAIENLIELMQRFAGLKRVRIAGDLCDGPATVEANQLLLLNSVYLCIRRAIESASESDVISVNTTCDKDELALSVRLPVGSGDAFRAMDSPPLNLLSEALGARLSSSRENTSITVTMHVPTRGVKRL